MSCRDLNKEDRLALKHRKLTTEESQTVGGKIKNEDI